MTTVSPRSFSSGQHQRNVGGGGSPLWGPTPLQPFANARLLLSETAIPGDTSSAVVASHVLECLLVRANYISAKENGPGVDTGDFTYNGYICRSARLPPNPGAIWLSSDLVWQQRGRRVASGGSTVVAPCTGWIWLGDLALLNPAGDADVDPYAQHTLFSVLEFGATYGSGGIGALVQPLIGERVFGTLKPSRATGTELNNLGALMQSP
jgi:hypothetical protein